MKTNTISKQSFNFVLLRNVSCKFQAVKRVASKFYKGVLVGALASGLLFAAAGQARAEDPLGQAITNSTQLLNLLSGVVPMGVPTIVAGIQDGSIKRVAPTYPVWILETETNSILYYQGQKDFAGQNATRLVDEKGFRFGLRALEKAASSRSTWMRITLGGAEYRAYCASKAPFVVCSLVR